MAEGRNSFLGKVVLASAGIVLAGAAAAAAGIAVGLKKWADDEDSKELKLVYGKDYGLRIAKGEKPGDYTVETRYDWQNDPEFADEDEGEEEDEEEDDDLGLQEEIPAEEVEVEVEAAEEAPAEDAEEEKPEE